MKKQKQKSVRADRSRRARTSASERSGRTPPSLPNLDGVEVEHPIEVEANRMGNLLLGLAREYPDLIGCTIDLRRFKDRANVMVRIKRDSTAKGGPNTKLTDAQRSV